MKRLFSIALLTALSYFHQMPAFGQGPVGMGTYILVDNRLVHYTGKLSIFSKELTAKDEKGKKSVWKASEVYWARIGTHRYLPVSGLQIPVGATYRVVEHGLAELLDSGRMSLLRYDYSSGYSGPMVTGGGAGPGMVGGYSGTSSAYLLQLPDEENAAVIPMNYFSGKGKKFREMLAPYFSSRPDLLQHLDNGEVARHNLVAFIHAYNSGQPFVPTSGESTKPLWTGSP